MNAKKQNAWRGVALSLALACFLGFGVYVTLTELSTVAANDFPDRRNGDPQPGPADDIYTYTSFLPVVFKMCPYQSTRLPLQGTADLAGEVKILTPQDCLQGVPAETPILMTGTYTGTEAHVTLWVLAYAPTGLYYPQSPDACQAVPPYQVDGDWWVPVYLGETGGPPEWFDLVVILTDEAASQFLGNHVQYGCLSGNYVGIPAAQLNQMAITEKSYIVVQTLD